MSQAKCDKCGWWMGNSPENHECPEHIRNKPTPKAERDNDVRWDEDEEGATASLRAKRIVTLDDLIEVCDIDLNEWYIERHVVNKWEVGAKNEDGVIEVEPLFQVKAWLKPTERFHTIIELIDAAKKDMLSSAPSWHTVTKVEFADEGVISEISLPDHHFGMHAWGEETRSANYDIKEAYDTYMEAGYKLVKRSGDVDGYVLVIGNDGIHADQPVPGSSAGGTTTKGTAQDMDTRLQKVFRTKTDATIEMIRMLASNNVPVYVIVIGGNHDYHTSFFLGEVIKATFGEHPNVYVDNTPPQRKYFQHGKILLGFTHGDKEKPGDLPLIMAQEAPVEWSETEYREWHVGHLHKKMSGLTKDSDEYKAVRVRWMPSLTPRDAWHASKGYIHQRSAESLLWHPEEGLVGSAVVNMGVG